MIGEYLEKIDVFAIYIYLRYGNTGINSSFWYLRVRFRIIIHLSYQFSVISHSNTAIVCRDINEGIFYTHVLLQKNRYRWVHFTLVATVLLTMYLKLMIKQNIDMK